MDKEKKDMLFKVIQNLSTISLSDDPAEAGLSDINTRIAEISNKNSRATVLYNKITRLLGNKVIQYTKLQNLYDMKMSRLLSIDEDVKEGSSKEERMSIAKMKLRKEIEQLNELKDEITELEILDKCIKSCLQSIKTAKESVSRQLSVLNQQMELGEVDRKKFPDT